MHRTEQAPLDDDVASLRAAGDAGSVRRRVLVADDNADMREYLVRLLSSHWRVDAVGDGEAALRQATVSPPISSSAT